MEGGSPDTDAFPTRPASPATRAPRSATELDAGLERRISVAGRALSVALNAVLTELPLARGGPQRLAELLGLDKVLASRLLRTARSKDPLAVAYHVPGPEPVRRFLRAAQRRGVDAARVRAAEDAMRAFQALVRAEVGDRSALDAVISTWLPEARREFELRRKQAAFRATSQLKGIAAETNLATVFLAPASDGERIDIVWVVGLLGLRRLRPGARTRLATRRIAESASGRHPLTLAGESVTAESVRGAAGIAGLRLDAFCHHAPAPLEVRAHGESVHYVLGEAGVGPDDVGDLILAEVNRAELPRAVPSGRRGYVFAEVSTPARALLFDVLVHEDVYPGAVPELFLYDTSFEGVADVNDPARDVDRLDLAASIEALGASALNLRAPDVPNYADLVRHAFDSLAWDGERFRVFRCRIDYPLYGSQVVQAFRPQPLAAGPTDPGDGRGA